VLPHGLLIAALAILLLVFKEWAYVTTYRLYLDRRVDNPAHSTATQRFDLDGARVIPRILMRDDQVSFRANIGQDATIRAEVRPEGKASYEIHIRKDAVDHVAAQGELTAPTSIVCPFPAGDGVVELVSHGRLTWSDLRLQQDLPVGRQLSVLGMLLASLLIWARVSRTRDSSIAMPAQPSRGQRFWLAMLMVFVSVALSTLVVEAGLRAVGTRLSDGISAARHDLGDVTDDPRWQRSPRYGLRLNSNVDAVDQWRYGDIVRMGFIPPEVSDGRVHRYPFRTDAEGFRNNATRNDIEVAALGDSFTDAQTMPIEAAWTTQLEQRIRRPVQNYGTAGFGPQQELLVLEDYAARHHPRVVVLAFFAGNDIRDAELFESFQQSHGGVDRPALGWPIKDIVGRADTWYVVSAFQAAATALMKPPAARDDTAATKATVASSAVASPSFDRGMFTVPVNGHVLRWSFMPPYLNLLNFSERDLAARRGWTLALEALIAMQRASRRIGAEFVLMFLPFKSQVYLPLLEETFSSDDLANAFHFYLPDTPAPPDVERMSRNRLAQNMLMRQFCEEANIPFLDMTAPLQARVEAGENMFFPDDSHLNEAGEAEVAASLAAFLQDRGLVSTGNP
jgi:lysophospholipase L1-like esterase